MKRLSIVGAFFLAFWLTKTAGAAAFDAGALPPLIVTASRFAETADETLSAVTVITRADMERRQDRDLIDVFGGVPGLEISNNGGAGKITSLFLRGTAASHVLVLIDGVRMGSVTTGQAAFQDIPIDQIDRIEIVRGPRAALYGPDALGGVVQIFTRRGGVGSQVEAGVSGGSYGSSRGSLGFSTGGKWGSLGLNGSAEGVQGFSAQNGAEPDRDGYKNTAGSGRLELTPRSNLRLALHGLRAGGSAEFDGSSQDNAVFLESAAGARAEWAMGPRARLTAAVGRSWDVSRNYKGEAFTGRYDSRRDNLTLQTDLPIGGNTLTVGADRLLDRVYSGTTYTNSSRGNTGVFVQARIPLRSADLQIAGRRDDNEQFGVVGTWSAAGGIVLGPVRGTVSHGTGFRAPTFNELYFPGFGNPLLNPERSRTTEFGLRDAVNGRWSVAAYETRITDMIGFDAFFNVLNIDEARIRGVEGTYTHRIGPWRLEAGAALSAPRNHAPGAFHGNELPRRSGKTFRADIDRTLGSWSLGGSWRAEDRRYEDLANTRPLGGFGLLDLRAEWRFAPAFRLQVKGSNLFDKRYETAQGYNQAGRAVYATILYRASTNK